MADLVDPDQIEAIVGIERHMTWHYANAVSAEQTLYILHSQRCKAFTPDLRECRYSKALDKGINLFVWADRQDMPVRITIDHNGQLIPL